MENLLNVSANPHVRSKLTTQKVMALVIIALMPATVFGVYNFGFKALIIILECMICCVLTEYLYEKFMKLDITIMDCSAALTGLLLGLNLPVSVPYWLPVIGSVFAILVVKMLFGGLGQNFMNPALGARCFLVISFASLMTNFTYDGVSTATPLAKFKAGEMVNTFDMVVGKIPGTIGETSVIAIVAGACLLIMIGVIDFSIPASYILSFVIFITLFGGHGFDWYYISTHLAGGGLMLGAFFMATDYVTSPVTPMGKIIFGIFLGIMTGLFRLFGGSAEGVSYAIILGNLLVPLIERVTIPKPFGKGGEKR